LPSGAQRFRFPPQIFVMQHGPYYEKPDNLGIPIKSRSEDDQRTIRRRSENA
jgi:hypothetical protein